MGYVRESQPPWTYIASGKFPKGTVRCELLSGYPRCVKRQESSFIMGSIDKASGTPPASRRDRNRERTRDEIYSSAMNLFLRRSFEAVTTEEICEAAGVARVTFFLHFPAK